MASDYEYISRLSPEQQQVLQQLIMSSKGKGAGGAYGTAADYYRDLLSDDSQTFNQMIAPEMRRFQEQIIPDLSEQFAGMGSGGLSSSGFRNAAVSAGTDLSERLGAIRANLRSQGAAGLSGIGQQALGDYGFQQQQGPGFLEQFLPGAVGAIGTAIGGPVLGAAGGLAANFLTSKMGSSSPYGAGVSSGQGRQIKPGIG